MKGARAIALALCLALAMLLPAGAVDARVEAAGLSGRRFLVLGDSYTAGYGLGDPKAGWVWRMTERYGMTQRNYAISGSSFAAGPNGMDPMVERVNTLPADENLDFILLQGGSNDCGRNIPLGQDGDRTADTCCGALNLILDALEARYPGVPIVGFTPWVSDGAQNALGLTRQDYSDAILRIFSARGYPCFDASAEAVSGVHMTDGEFRAKYCIRPEDWHHLNAAGHARFAPVFAAWLGQTLYGVCEGDWFYDLAGASEAEKTAVSVLMEDGVFQGAGGRLFAPSRSANRAALALTLHRMAGSPAGGERMLGDVEAGTELHRAVCWAMEAEIFSEAENFSPEGVLTRQMLATALYRYFQWSGGTVASLTGLGIWPDGGDVARYARVPMAWAIHAGVLTAKDGKALPGGAVSRGQLALALYRLRQL